MANATVVVEHHQFAILCGIRLPDGKRVNVGFAAVGKLRPDAAHLVSQQQVVGSRRGQVVLGTMEGVEAELQLVTVNGAVVQWRAPGEHIHIGRRLTLLRNRIGSDDGLGTEEPVDAQQVLR